MRPVRLFILSALLPFLLTHCTSSSTPSSSAPQLVAEKHLILGLSADYPPFESKKDGQYVGFDIDLARELAQDLGYSLSIEDLEFSSLIPALHSGRVYFIMSGMSITEERKKSVDFTNTYFQSSFAILYRIAHPLTHPVTPLSELAGKKIGAQLGSTMEKYAKKQAASQPGLTIIALGKNPLLIQELKSGRLQGVLVENIQAKAFVDANPELKFSLMPPYSETTSPNTESQNDQGYAIAVSKTNTQNLLQKLNQTLEKFSKNGKLETLQRKWFGSP